MIPSKCSDVKTFSIGMGGMGKAKKDNVLKENGIPGPGQYRIKGFAEILAEKGKKISDNRDKIRRREKVIEMRKKEDEKNLEKEEIGKKGRKIPEMKLDAGDEDDDENANEDINNDNELSNNEG